MGGSGTSLCSAKGEWVAELPTDNLGLGVVLVLGDQSMYRIDLFWYSAVLMPLCCYAEKVTDFHP